MESREEMNNRLRAELDALCSKYFGSKIDGLRKYEIEHEYVVTHGPNTYGRFESQFRAFFDLSTEVILGSNYIDKKEWPVHRSLQLLFIVHNLKTLYNAVDRLLKGHWEDSLTLMRVNFEALIRIVWISCYPERSSAGVHKTNEGKQFNLTGFVNDELKLKWHTYKFLSAVAHGNQISVIRDWVAIHKKEKIYPVQVETKFDKEHFEMCLNSIGFFEIFFSLLLTEIFATSTNSDHLPREIIDDLRKLARCKQESLLAHKGNYWPVVMRDIDDLISLIRATDGGEDYKIAWQRIRVVKAKTSTA